MICVVKYLCLKRPILSQEIRCNIIWLAESLAERKADFATTRPSDCASRWDRFCEARGAHFESSGDQKNVAASPAVFLLFAGALSGFIVGSLARGAFLLAVAVLVALMGAGLAGWWARGGE